MGSFDRGMAAALPVGSVIQSPLNLESMTNGQWIALDGRDCNRSDYPLIQSQFPAGVFTSTARTLAAAPSSAVIAADGTNFCAAAVLGTTPLQTSSDGVSWGTGAGGFTAGTAFNSIIVAGSRWVIAGSAGETQPLVQATGGTAANLASKASWTATTGGVNTTLTQGLAYGPTANGGSGRTVLVKDGSLATASGIFYLNDGATAWSAASGGSTISRKAVVWTGQKFIAFGSGAGANASFLIQTSADGATWADGVIPLATMQSANSVYSVASDGKGTVVVSVTVYHSISMYGLFVTKDHGDTWRFIPTPVEAPISAMYISYVNGLFIAGCAAGSYKVAFSADGISWVIDDVVARAGATATGVLQGFAYKAGVYAFITTNVQAFTATENKSKFRLWSLFYNTNPQQLDYTLMRYLKVRN